jgi:hypothetical protein
MPVLSYQVNAPGYGGINPKLVYIFTDDPVAVVTTTGYIDWLANQQGIYTGDVALIVTRQTPTSVFAANFYEFQRVGNGPHWDLIPESGSTLVQSVSGTLNQIIASPTTGNVVVSISPNAILPGDESVNLPVGNTAQRAGAAGSIRFNSQIPQFEVTLDGINWVALTTGGGGGSVNSVTGTTNEVVASPTTGNVIVSIASNPVLPGTAEVVLPTGTTGQRGSTAGGLRMNTQLSEIELTNDGVNWYAVSTSNDTVSSVIGTANRITVTGTSTAQVDIASNYVGQTSIDTLGTVTIGSWNASTITVPYGGTGSTSFVANAPVIGGSTTTSPLLSAATGISNIGYVLTSTGSSSAPTWQQAPGSVVTQTVVPITVADIQGCYATPFQILAAPGSGLMISVLNISVQMTIGSTAYSIPGSTNLWGFQYGNLSAHLGGVLPVNPIQGQSFMGVTNNKLGFPLAATNGVSGAPGIVSSSIGNQGIYMSANNVITGGTGSGDSYVTISYMIINVGM